MSSRVFLVSDDRQAAEAVSAVFKELQEFGPPVVLASGAQARIETVREAPDLLLVDEKVENHNGLAVARELAGSFPLLPVCLLAGRGDAAFLRAAMEAGVRAVLPLPPSVEQYAEQLSLTSQWARAVHAEVRQEREDRGRAVGRVVVVVGSKGGVGASLVALTAARACARGGRTALVDFDLRGGDLAGYCGVHVRHSVVDLALIASEVGGREVSEVAYPVRGGIELFPSPEHEERGEEMTEEAARQIVQALRYQYDRVVVDGGSRVDEAMAAALDLADEVVVVATPEVPALRGVRRLRSTMERLDIGRGAPVHLLLNRSSRKAEIQPASAARLAGADLLAALPDSSAQLEPVLNTADLLDAEVPALVAAGQAVSSLAEPAGPAAGGGEAGAEDEVVSARPWRARRGRSGGWSAWSRLRGERGEDGGVAVEFVGGIILAVGFLFLCLQLLLLGGTALMAHNSAQEAARDYAVGMSQEEVVRRVGDRLPGGLASRMSVSRSGDRATVVMGFPGAWPGVGPVDASARIQSEERQA